MVKATSVIMHLIQVLECLIWQRIFAMKIELELENELCFQVYTLGVLWVGWWAKGCLNTASLETQ